MLKNLLKKIKVVFYRENGLPGEETIREMTVEAIKRLSIPIIKNELLKNNVVMEDKDIGYMTYEIVKELHNNGVVYCEEELRKKTQEYISKNLYKNYIGHLYSQKIDEAMSIVEYELKKYKINLVKEVLRIFAKDVLSLYISEKYGLYGYDEEDIKDMTVATIRGLSRPIIKGELIKNNVVMENRYIWLMTYDIVQELCKKGVGYSREEIRKITQEYITKGLYKNYIDWLDANLSKGIIERKLAENKVNMYGGQRWLMTYDIVQELRKKGVGYSREEIRKITQEYINKGLYKNYIGCAGYFNDDKIL
jgi:hypothetical protein